MVESPMFDVFLAHNSADKPQVRAIAVELEKRGLKPWLDEEQIAPGELFQSAIQKAIPQIKSAAICIGLKGLGRWQVIELQTLISQFVNKGSRVIPVLLPGVDRIPDNLLFLQQFNWVSFENIDDADSLYKLEWGITGVKPKLEQRSSTSGPPSEVTASPLPKPKRRIIELKSEKGVDYTKLRDLLAAGEWKEADLETGKVMCQAAGKESEGWLLDVQDIDNFPCEDLRTINQLWLHYSDDKFGFSVQKEIYSSLGGTKEYNYEVFENFCDRIGWRKGGTWLSYSDLTFNLKLAPQAHLPASLGMFGGWIGGGRVLQRVVGVGVLIVLLSRKDL